MAQDATIRTWRKRIKAAEDTKQSWQDKVRTQDSYDYWRGDQLVQPFDENDNRKVIVNKIHAEVRSNIPSMYFYRPFARITAEPEEADTPGSRIEERSKLLQDTANYLVRHRDTAFRENTYLPLLEAHWSIGCVEVGYSAEFVDAPNAIKPELKEKKDTKVNKQAPAEIERDEDGLPVELDSDMFAIQRELDRIRRSLKSEKFYVRHIPSNRLLVSASDRPCLLDNDWVGYWEDIPVQDVKSSKAYKNTRGLKAAIPGGEKRQREAVDSSEKVGEPEKVRLYKIWNLRTKERMVIAEQHDKYLLRKSFKRCPLIYLRFDIDPYHFWPIPPIYHKLGPQDEYNKSRQFLSTTRDRIVPKYTVDEDAISADNMKKLEKGIHSGYVYRKGGTSPDSVSAINQPSHNENAIQALTFSDKEFNDVGGVGGDARISQEATATQAKIAAVKEQTADSYDRGLVADFLGRIIKELLQLAIENMNVQRAVQVNIAPDTPMFDQLAFEIQQDFQAIDAQRLQDESTGMTWDVTVDVESMSPVSEEEAWQKWQMGLQFIADPSTAMLFSVAPELLDMTLEKMGMKSARSKGMLQDGLQKYVQMQMQMAQMGQQQKGISPMGGGTQPGQPQSDAGGPQPGGPPGPGASNQ